jgi:hypothetical protein
LFFLSGCAAGGRSPASDAEQFALANYNDCMNYTARDLDDHRSDLAAIASAVAGACRSQARAFEETLYQGLAAADRETLLAQLALPESRMRAATHAVSLERSGERLPVIWPFAQ